MEELLRQLSILWSLFHILILFILIYRSRYSLKTTMIATGICMGLLILGNVWGLARFGPGVMGKLFILTCTLPSLVFFFYMSKDRGGRFFFTFCITDTIALWIIAVTNLLDFYLHGQCVIMLVNRIVAFPLLEFFVYRYLRKPYLEVQSHVEKGWWIFALMTALYYMLLAVMSNWPTVVTDRPHDLPAMFLVLLLMPMTYLVIFFALYRQLLLFRTQQQQRELRIQMETYEAQLENQRMIRQMKHDMKAHFAALTGMLAEGRSEEAKSYLQEASDYSDELAGSKYCEDPYLNGVLTQFVARFEKLETAIEIDVSVPIIITHRVELCLILSNALENAWEASQKLPVRERFVSLQMRKKHNNLLLIRIKNHCDKRLVTREGTLPKSTKQEAGHGFGLPTMKELAARLGGEIVCYAEGGLFVVDVMVKI